MAKYDQFARVLEKRILQGDYALGDLPTEQEFAQEVGVSRATARRAMTQLVEKGVIERKPHHRPTVSSQHRRVRIRPPVGLLIPAYESSQYSRWSRLIQRVASNHDVMVRMMYYVHWDDPTILQALRSYDGLFLISNSEPIPDRLLQRFSRARNLVSLDNDLTDCRVPSILMLPHSAVQLVGDHLHQLGHRRIDCLNTQPHDRVINARLEQWSLWKNLRQVTGRLHDDPVHPYEEPTRWAYEVVGRALTTGDFTATALLCLTDAAAEGANRAFCDHGLVVGRDVSIGAPEHSERAPMATPSRTTLEAVDPVPYLEACIRQFDAGGTGWSGPLLIQPGAVRVRPGESTGPAPPG